jgi:rhamnosyltransferase
MEKVGCVMVLYNPNWDITTKAFESIKSQVNEIFVSDNSDYKDTNIEDMYSNIVYHFMNGNSGIAAAQNVGIEYFKKKEYDYIIYLDQDSIAPQNLVFNLLATFKGLISDGIKIGAIGPRPYNRGENKKYKGSIKKGRRYSENITEVTELISSATLVSLGAIKSVGNLDAYLFIDGVDHEWCWRATELGGYRFFIDETVLLSHQLGEGDRNFFFKKVAIPTPFRTYYQYRNYFILIKRNYVPLYWKMSNGVKYVVKLLYYPTFVSPRIKYLSNMLRGIRDGIKLCLGQ